MPIPNHSFHITLTPSGKVNSRFPDGNDGTGVIPLVWATIPSSLGNQEGTPVSINVRAYLTEPGSPPATLSIVGSVPSGWLLSGDNLQYSGTGQGSAAIRIRATRLGVTVDSGFFTVESIPSAAADNLPPTVPTGLIASLVAGPAVALSWDAASDVKAPGVTASGLKDYQVSRNGSPIGSPVAAPSVGLSLQLAAGTIGAPNPSVSASSQTGPDYTLTVGGDAAALAGTADSLAYDSVQITGNFTITASVSLGTASSPAAKAGIMCRASLDPGASFVHMAKLQGSAGIAFDVRATEGGSVSRAGTASGFTEPVLMRITRTGSIWTGQYWDGSTWKNVGSASVGMTDPCFTGVAANSGASGASISPMWQQVNIQNIAGSAYTDASVSAGNTYNYSVSARDVNGNVSAGTTPIAVNVPSVPSGKNYPLFAIMAQGTLNARTQASADRLAMHHLAITAFYVGIGKTSFNGSDGAFIDYVHSKSKCGTKIGRYTIFDTYSGDGAWTEKTALVNANNWGLYKVGSSGAQPPNYYNASWLIVNQSTYAPKVGGLSPCEGIMKLYLDYMVDGTKGGASQSTDVAPNEDLRFWDNFACRISVGGKTSVNSTYQADWNRDGTPDYQSQVGPPSGTDLDAAMRAGMGLGVQYLRTRKPNMELCGNISGWGSDTATNGINFTQTSSPPTGIIGLAHGGFLEAQAGLSYSFESWGGHALNLSMYKYAMANMDPATQRVWMHHSSLNGYDYVQQSGVAYQCTRWALSFTLMGNGYHCASTASATFTDYKTDASSAVWLDGYVADVDPASPTFMRFIAEANVQAQHYGYLGQFITAPFPAPLSGLGAGNGNGLLVRFTTNSRGQTFVVINNPRGNGAQTLNFFAKYGKRLNKFFGIQETTVNNGATNVGSVTLQDRDGLIAMVV